ncbi:MAG: hypothetical protein H6Q02_1347 [Acidobacteria bacterium]|nr:hypothetical protein [Acidobacteriota bacterium]
MSKKAQGVVLLVVGVLLFLVSLAADALGVGAATGLGWKQIVGAVAGVVLAGAGMAMQRRAAT